MAIVGIFAALFPPALSRAQASARQSACMSNLRQVGLGIRLYAKGNRDILPIAPHLTGDDMATNLRVDTIPNGVRIDDSEHAASPIAAVRRRRGRGQGLFL